MFFQLSNLLQGFLEISLKNFLEEDGREKNLHPLKGAGGPVRDGWGLRVGGGE